VNGQGQIPEGIPDDAALVEALRRGDLESARLLVETYQGVVFGLCLRMLGHRQDAEDAAQESFLRALRGIHGFEGGRSLKPWLLGIAANRCRTALARRPRRPVPVDGLEDLVDPRRPRTDAEELSGELVRAVARLRGNYRLVFTMYHEHGLPYEEIAVALNRPLGTIKTWLHRARARLADDLSRRGVHC
jgi:RNA polymerase sigma-70 factor (ECF subfamily)